MEVAKLLNKTFNFESPITGTDLTRYNSKFVNKQFENRESDIIYKLKNKNIFFLIEHQSTIDYKMAQRIAEYQMEIIKIENKGSGNKKKITIPLIIPLVIYTSRKSKWKAKKKLSAMQLKIKGYKNLELGEYNIVDVNVMKMDELLNAELFIYRLLALEKAKDEVELNNAFEHILYTEKNKENIKILRDMAEYVYKGVLKNKEITRELFKKEEGEGKMNFITMIEEKRDSFIEEGRREGREEGRQEGRQEGIQKSKIDIAKELLKLGIKVEDIKKSTKLTQKDIEKLENELQKT